MMKATDATKESAGSVVRTCFLNVLPFHDIDIADFADKQGDGWTCGCNQFFWCSAGCAAPHYGHSCELRTANPTPAPTPPSPAPTASPSPAPSKSPTRAPTLATWYVSSSCQAS